MSNPADKPASRAPKVQGTRGGSKIVKDMAANQPAIYPYRWPKKAYDRDFGGDGLMQPGIVGLRRVITAAWQEDLRAVRRDAYDMETGKEAWSFIQRLYNLVSELRTPIQRAWGPGGLVHVADNPDLGGPGPRVSLTRIKLRNHGSLVAVEAWTPTDH